MQTLLSFDKMHGCGNDYIYFDCFNQKIDDPVSLSIKLSDRHFGVGGDGVILVCPSEIADAKMRMFNLDGSEGKMCGNGIRCVAKFCRDHNLVEKDTMDIETLSGIKHIELVREGDEVVGAKVDMGQAMLSPADIPVLMDGDKIVARSAEFGGIKYDITCVSMGNPHCVVFTKNIDDIDIEKVGKPFETSPLFPEQVNTEFVEIISRNELKMRVWERGSGETWACGTGTCACVVAAIENGICDNNTDVLVHLRGGDLIIRRTDETVFMTGNAVTVFSGAVKA